MEACAQDPMPNVQIASDVISRAEFCGKGLGYKKEP